MEETCVCDRSYGVYSSDELNHRAIKSNCALCFKKRNEYLLSNHLISANTIRKIIELDSSNCLKLYLEHGYDPNKNYSAVNGYLDNEPLANAVMYNSYNCAKLLLVYGAEVNDKVLEMLEIRGTAEMETLFADLTLTKAYR